MRINDYEFIDPQGSEVGADVEGLGRSHPWRLERLTRCVEDFVQQDTELSCRVLAEEVEIFLVPPRAVLAHIPDAAVLVRVDHANRRIDLIHLVPQYGGYEERAQWEALIVLAHQVINRESGR